MRQDSDILCDLGGTLRQARLSLAMTQDGVAKAAGLSRARYREIETGTASARATTLINIARALSLEVMLIPHAAVPAVQAMMSGVSHDNFEDDVPAFVPSPQFEEDR